MLPATNDVPTPRVWLQLSAASAILFALELALVERNVFLGREEQIRDGVFNAGREALPIDALPYLQGGLIIGDPNRPYLSLAALVIVGLAVMLVLLLIRRRIWSALLLCTAAPGGVALSTALKSMIVRPGTWSPGGHTFPSGHACVSMALFLTLAYLLGAANISTEWKQRGRHVLIFLLALSAYSILTFHYPTELIAGYLVAYAWWSLLMAMLAGPLAREWREGGNRRHQSLLNAPSVY